MAEIFKSGTSATPVPLCELYSLKGAEAICPPSYYKMKIVNVFLSILYNIIKKNEA